MDIMNEWQLRQKQSKKRTYMLDPMTNFRIAGLEQRRLLNKAERTSEARRSEPVKPRGAFPYELWLARLGGVLIKLGMKLQARPGTTDYRHGLNIS